MYKVMIVEDDIPTLNFLKGIINWSDLGIELAYDTSSSLEALEVLEQVDPDIILTDIGLPHMNGLELVTTILEKKPHIRVVFLTCHEEFSYAKEAVKLNADDYLIKDELTPDKLEASLRKTISMLVKENMHDKQNVIKNVHFLKSALLNKIIDCSDERELKYYIDMLNHSWVKPDYKMMIGYLPVSQENSKRDYTKSLERVYYSLSEFLYGNEAIEVFLNEGHLVFLFNYKIDIKVNIEEYLQDIIESCIKYCEEELEIKINFGQIKQTFRLQNLGKSYQDILRNRYRYFYRKDALIQKVDLESQYDFIPLGSQLKHKKEELLKAVEIRNEEEIEHQIGRIREIITTTNIEPNDILQKFIEIISFIEYRTTPSIDGPYFPRKLGYCWTMEEAILTFSKKLKGLILQNQVDQPTTNDTKNMQEIDNYIAENLEYPIRSIDMAKHLYFNPSYFSRYFKRLTGQTFTDYVNEYKMKAASRYLLNTSEPIENIALKVGYNERTYFSKVFKKNIGITPSQYRSKQRIS